MYLEWRGKGREYDRLWVQSGGEEAAACYRELVGIGKVVNSYKLAGSY